MSADYDPSTSPSMAPPSRPPALHPTELGSFGQALSPRSAQAAENRDSFTSLPGHFKEVQSINWCFTYIIVKPQINPARSRLGSPNSKLSLSRAPTVRKWFRSPRDEEQARCAAMGETPSRFSVPLPSSGPGGRGRPAAASRPVLTCPGPSGALASDQCAQAGRSSRLLTASLGSSVRTHDTGGPGLLLL